MSTSKRSNFGEANRPYRPYGSALEVFYDKGPEIILSGPAGTGKSRGCLEKIHACAEKYPGARIGILRKTRASLTQTALVTFETKVVPVGHPILSGPARRQRASYVYPNGSEIVVAGLDKPEKIMSSEFDMFYVQEAIETLENDWEFLTTRLRNGVMPYQQIIGDTNPEKPTHWIKVRSERKQLHMIQCRHEDNPVFWDLEKNDYTPMGVQYVLGVLDKLTGVRLKRLRFGEWVGAEGVVYAGYDSAVHRINLSEVPEIKSRFWTIDWGYTNPFVWQEWGLDADGRMYRLREIYKTKTLVEDHARRIIRLTKKDPKPTAIYVDHDAEDRATFEKHTGLVTTPAHKTIRDGIQAFESRLAKAGDGKPRIYFVRDGLDERDRALEEAKLPCSTEEEFDGYIWPVVKSNRNVGEVPVDKDNHGMDATRYAVASQDLLEDPIQRAIAAMKALTAAGNKQ